MVATPVITTPVCGNPELVTHEENGILVEQGDLESLTTQIHRILNDPDLREHLVERGIRSVQQYSWDRVSRQTMEVLCGY